MVPKLYSDSISIDAYPEPRTQVSFLPFRGIAPRSYERLFEMRDRKDERGKALQWKETSATPRLQQFYASYISLERQIITNLRGELEALGLKRVQTGSDEHGKTRMVGPPDAAG
jgi:cytidine deaminase